MSKERTLHIVDECSIFDFTGIDLAKSPDQIRIAVVDTNTGVFNIVDSFEDFCKVVLEVELTPIS